MTSQSPRSLLALSDEILTFIFEFLCVPHLVAVRRACKRLMKLTGKRSLWQYHYRALLESGIAVPTLLRPLSDYSDAQLEDLVLTVFRVDHIWRSVEPRPRKSLKIGLHEREGSTYGSRIASMCLLPGGRWLFTASVSGTILSWDLESRNEGVKCLVLDEVNLPPNADPRHSELELKTQVSVCGSECVVLLRRSVLAPIQNYRDESLYIWTVGIRSESQAVAKSPAVRIFEFHPEISKRTSVSLERNLLAFAMGTVITVLDWKTSSEEWVRAGTICPTPEPPSVPVSINAIKLIPPNILVVSSSGIALYPLPNLVRTYRTSIGHSTPQHSTPPLLRFKFDPHAFAKLGLFRAISNRWLKTPPANSPDDINADDCIPRLCPISILYQFGHVTIHPDASGTLYDVIPHLIPVNRHEGPIVPSSRYAIGENAKRGIWVEEDTKNREATGIALYCARDKKRCRGDETWTLRELYMGSREIDPNDITALAVDEGTGRVCMAVLEGKLYVVDFVKVSRRQTS